MCCKDMFFISLEPTERAIVKAWDFCAVKSRSIEVLYKDEDCEEEVLTRVHFNLSIVVCMRGSWRIQRLFFTFAITQKGLFFQRVF